MAIYRLSLSSIKRSDGRSAVAAAAYRAGERLHDDRADKTHDYRKKGRSVVRRELIGWRGSRADLWNRAEQDKHPRAQVAREIQIGLPSELPARCREMLAVDFAHYLRDRFGVAVDLAIHLPNAKGDQRNAHCHLLFTTRVVDDAGAFGAKTRELDMIQTSRPAVEEMRRVWGDACNAALRLYGSAARLDHRSYARQGVNIESESHSRAGLETEKRGERTYSGDGVRERRRRNRKRRARAITGAAARYAAALQSEPAADVERSQRVQAGAPASDSVSARTTGLTDAEREEIRSRFRAAQSPKMTAPPDPKTPRASGRPMTRGF